MATLNNILAEQKEEQDSVLTTFSRLISSIAQLKELFSIDSLKSIIEKLGAIQSLTREVREALNNQKYDQTDKLVVDYTPRNYFPSVFASLDAYNIDFDAKISLAEAIEELYSIEEIANNFALNNRDQNYIYCIIDELILSLEQHFYLNMDIIKRVKKELMVSTS